MKELDKSRWVGERFGRWTVLDVWLPRAALARCDCGTEKVVDRMNLKAGVSRSCGCLAREVTSRVMRTHGLSGTRTKHSWAGMLARCTRPSSNRFEMYAGRGIAVCERWRSFENFLADMGACPAGMSIERIDNQRGYEPGNCRWASPKEQARNTRRNLLIELHGKVAPLSEHVEERFGDPKGRDYHRIWYRLRKLGMSPESAFAA